MFKIDPYDYYRRAINANYILMMSEDNILYELTNPGGKTIKDDYVSTLLELDKKLTKVEVAQWAVYLKTTNAAELKMDKINGNLLYLRIINRYDPSSNKFNRLFYDELEEEMFVKEIIKLTDQDSIELPWSYEYYYDELDNKKLYFDESKKENSIYVMTNFEKTRFFFDILAKKELENSESDLHRIFYSLNSGKAYYYIINIPSGSIEFMQNNSGITISFNIKIKEDSGIKYVFADTIKCETGTFYNFLY